MLSSTKKLYCKEVNYVERFYLLLHLNSMYNPLAFTCQMVHTYTKSTGNLKSYIIVRHYYNYELTKLVL